MPNRQQVTFEKVEIAGGRSDWKPSENIIHLTPWELAAEQQVVLLKKKK